MLKKGCLISALSNLAGNVSVGKYTYLGLSCCVKEGVSIGDHSIVGMGSVVLSDVEDETVVVGNPASRLRDNYDRKVFNKR